MTVNYVTSDTSLTAWLVSNGIKLIRFNNLVHPGEFVLDNSNPKILNDLIFSWDSGNAPGNCAIYFKTYRQLVHLIQGKRG